MNPREITGRHVLYGLLAFFGAVIAANAVFIYLAVESFTGLSTDNPYQRGLEYNQTLAARQAQAALGWQGTIAYAEKADGAGRLAATLHTAGGLPLEDLRVTGQIRRPTHDGLDQDLVLTRSAAGTYATDITLPERGQWDVTLVAESRDGKRFEMVQRLWLK